MSHALNTHCTICNITDARGCPECGPGVNHGTWDSKTCHYLPGCPALERKLAEVTAAAEREADARFAEPRPRLRSV